MLKKMKRVKKKMGDSVDSSSSLQDLQSYLVSKFSSWRPSAPEVLLRRRGDVTLSWSQELFAFLGDQLMYRLEKNDKIPKWVVVYSGGKTTKRIDDLAPRHPHRFRVKVILKATAVPHLAELAIQHYGDDNTVIEKIEELCKEIEDKENENNKPKTIEVTGSGKDSFDRKSDSDSNSEAKMEEQQLKLENIRQVVEAIKEAERKKRIDSGRRRNGSGDSPRWLESQWSGETWTNTDADGTSPPCFAMAVKCGYLKQVQMMAEERPELLEIVNSCTGHTPLATAVRKGDISTVRLLLSLGAQVEQPSLAGQTPLHLAVLSGDESLVELLLEKGAHMKSRDCNGLRAEHYAVDSCSVDMVRYILDHGGDVAVKDNNGWTPLFRAVCQGASSSIVSELVSRGSKVEVVDSAGLPLLSAAKLLRNRHGRTRDSIVRLVDSAYPREKALAHFTRVSRKIHHLHTILRLN